MPPLFLFLPGGKLCFQLFVFRQKRFILRIRDGLAVPGGEQLRSILLEPDGVSLNADALGRWRKDA